MERFLKFCTDLDELGYFAYADNVFTKYAYTQSELFKKQILIPGNVKAMAVKAYGHRNKDVKFGTIEDIEIARQLSQRSYLELDTVLKIHKITAKTWHSHSKKDDSPKYWEYLCYGGDEGKSWAENIIKIYLTKDWRIN
jgi:dolichyl-phosphate-mannose--protein O-mannosyl transferase